MKNQRMTKQIVGPTKVKKIVFVKMVQNVRIQQKKTLSITDKACFVSGD